MLRIHFSDLDLARTTVAATPSPAIELFASLRLIQRPYVPLRFAAWRDRLRARPDPGRLILTGLVPANGCAVTLLEPDLSARSAADAVDAFTATPADLIYEEVSLLLADQRLPLPRRQLLLIADGRRAAVEAVGAAVHSFHTAAVAPGWDTIRRAVDSDLARRYRLMLTGGVAALLSTLGPGITWRFPVLEVSLAGGFDFDVHLGGHGLLLQPSFFAHAQPLIWNFGEPRPTLVYPVAREPVRAAPDTDTDALGDLLGRTRAEILLSIAATGGRTTTDLARALDISAAAVSQHTAVLRKAGLIVTLRQGRAVLHTATPQAATLLQAA